VTGRTGHWACEKPMLVTFRDSLAEQVVEGGGGGDHGGDRGGWWWW